jgi:hypothetical protein
MNKAIKYNIEKHRKADSDEDVTDQREREEQYFKTVH